MFGMFIGGFLADAYGYKNTFIISGILLGFAGMLATAFVKENFQRAPQKSSERKLSLSERWRALGPGTLILLLVIWVGIGRRLDGGILPIYIQELHGGLEGASRWSGVINAAGGFGAIIAGVCGGMIFDRWRPHSLIRIVALGAAIALTAIGMSSTLPALIPLRFALMLFAAAFDPINNTWIAQITPGNRKGAMFGLDHTPNHWHDRRPLPSGIIAEPGQPAPSSGSGPLPLLIPWLHCCQNPAQYTTAKIKAHPKHVADSTCRLFRPRPLTSTKVHYCPQSIVY